MTISHYQFSLRRFLSLSVITAVAVLPFALLPWPAAMLIIACLNGAAYVAFCLKRKRRLGEWFFLAGLLWMVAFVFTDWGFSSLKPIVRVSWPLVIAAGLAQVVSVGYWLIDGSHSSKK